MSNQTRESSQQKSEIAGDAEELLQATANATDDTVVEARNRLAAAMETAKEMYTRAQKRVVQGAQVTDKAIREHPYQAIGVAFGVGALIGFLLARRSRD
jgi:ElaB/YqjD/DUF883 family membrane-anchored ribosome-binding protein